MKILNKFTFPPIGLRIIKSAVGVLLCYLVYLMRGEQGIVFYSQLAVLWCIQPYVSGTLDKAKQRTTGTIIGAFFGLIAICIRKYILLANQVPDVVYYLLVSVLIIPVLYTTVVIKKKDASYFSTVVFLSIVVVHIGDANPVLFTFNRFLDTMIGIAIGVVVNIFRIPRKKRNDILFISGVDDTLLNEEEVISPYSKIELNRMIEDGAQFTVATMRTPASIIDALGDIHWKLPLITMDGAGLYDMKEGRFLEAVDMDHPTAKKLITYLEGKDLCCFANIVIDGLLVISHHELRSDVEKKLYQDLHFSAYRHYVKADLMDQGKMLYIMCIGNTEKISNIYQEILAMPCANQLKILCHPCTKYQGCSFLKIYDKAATRDNMVEILKEKTGLHKTLTFGSIAGKYDVVVTKQANQVASTLEKVYEPYFWEKF